MQDHQHLRIGRPITIKSNPMATAFPGVVTRLWSSFSNKAHSGRIPGVTAINDIPNVAFFFARTDHAEQSESFIWGWAKQEILTH